MIEEKSKVPNRYELIDKDGRVYMAGSSDGMMLRRFVFESAMEAASFAGRLWPNQEQDPDRTGKGWDIQLVGVDG